MNLMCANHLAVIYRLYLDRGFGRLALIEANAEGGTPVPVTEDDRRNERAHYERLFSNECLAFVLGLYADMTNRMMHCSYAEAVAPLAVLKFLQEIVATALWRYGLEAGEDLTRFAREFDRLDVEEERARLYELVTQGNLQG